MRELQPNSYASSNGSTSVNSDTVVVNINQDPQQQEQNRVAMTAAAGQRQGGGGVVGMGVGLGKGKVKVKVMTDEQMEMLRKQICVYATISKRLVDLQNAISHSGTRLTGPYGDPLLSSAVNKIPSRQRWTPTSMQLEILERMFKQCNSTPGRQKIKEITDELSQHGQISEANVYNWFQNRRARSKRKQPPPAAVSPNTGESGGGGGGEATTSIAPAKEKTSELEVDIQPPDENLASIISHMQFQGPDIGIDQLIGEMGAPGNCW